MASSTVRTSCSLETPFSAFSCRRAPTKSRLISRLQFASLGHHPVQPTFEPFIRSTEPRPLNPPLNKRRGGHPRHERPADCPEYTRRPWTIQEAPWLLPCARSGLGSGTGRGVVRQPNAASAVDHEVGVGGGAGRDVRLDDMAGNVCGLS